MSWRKRFAKPAPEGWTPKFGELVYVAPVEGTLARLVSTGHVVGHGDGTVKVKLGYGRQKSVLFFLKEHLRPIPRDLKVGDRVTYTHPANGMRSHAYTAEATIEKLGRKWATLRVGTATGQSVTRRVLRETIE